uniref:Gypsy retrotransposon integrase-like protein 1 n=1 Tax=Cyprinus carpio carpio TaxID=630221 RepID=A0A9J8B026_CYPCA
MRNVLDPYRQKKTKAYSTWYSQAVSHPSTNQARLCLASEIRRDRARSGWYGRKRGQLQSVGYLKISHPNAQCIRSVLTKKLKLTAPGIYIFFTLIFFILFFSPLSSTYISGIHFSTLDTHSSSITLVHCKGIIDLIFPYILFTFSKKLRGSSPHQARWVLFFTRFDFVVSYRPGSKNGKADALSRLHHSLSEEHLPEPILPPAVFVCPILWDLDKQIPKENRLHPAPPGGPEGLIFVPQQFRTALLDSAHTAPGSGHPGSRRTLSLLNQRYWWPSIYRDVSQFVRGCSVCTITNTPRKLPEGKLVPLPIPHRPWSHLGVDFMTDLPKSNNFTCILVAVDRFSKACKLIPLPGLPTAFETAEALFNHVFRNFGIPKAIVSDRGPQFISRVWQAFFRLLGVTVSLSSGYHPQTNGQTERKIQEIGRYLRSYCHQYQDSWSRYLPWAEYAQNSLRQSTTGLTPFQCILGFQPPLFPWSGEPSEVPAVDYWFHQSERVWDSAHVHVWDSAPTGSAKAQDPSRPSTDRPPPPGSTWSEGVALNPRHPPSPALP